MTTTALEKFCKPCKLNFPIALGAKDSIRFKVEKNQTYRVYSYIDREGIGTSSKGWTYSQKEHAELHGPAGVSHGFPYDESTVCRSAAYGQLIAAWLPDTSAVNRALENLDLTKKEIPVKDGDAMRPIPEVLRTLFSSSFPVGVTEDQISGDDCWMGMAPYTGWLVLLQNDSAAPYTDNEGAIIVNVRGIEPSFTPNMGMQPITKTDNSSENIS